MCGQDYRCEPTTSTERRCDFHPYCVACDCAIIRSWVQDPVIGAITFEAASDDEEPEFIVMPARRFEVPEPELYRQTPRMRAFTRHPNRLLQRYPTMELINRIASQRMIARSIKKPKKSGSRWRRNQKLGIY